MEVSRDFDRVPGVVVVTISGGFSETAYVASLHVLRRHPRYELGMPIITDLSSLDGSVSSTSEARSLGLLINTTDTDWGTTRRAVVAPANLTYGLARAAQSAADPDGGRMTIVRTFDEAVAWVLGRPPE